jgi:Flp pilus assembly pilin Flp
MNSIRTTALCFRDDTSAVTSLEYGIICALMTVILLSAMANLGHKLSVTLSTITAAFPAG